MKMKDFAMMVWNMPSDEFGGYLLIGAFALFVVYETVIEINTNRIKRFNR